MKDNNVKIIGGKWKRKSISFHEAKGLRPTLGKVRETLFNWLGQDLNNKSMPRFVCRDWCIRI